MVFIVQLQTKYGQLPLEGHIRAVIGRYLQGQDAYGQAKNIEKTSFLQIFQWQLICPGYPVWMSNLYTLNLSDILYYPR